MADGDTLYPLEHYISKMTPGQRRCRSRGQHHWPSEYLGLGETIPGFMRGIRNPGDGSYLVEENCIDCGKQSYWYSLPRGVYDSSISRKYRPYEGEVHIPREIHAGSRMIRGILVGDSLNKMFGPTSRRKAK